MKMILITVLTSMTLLGTAFGQCSDADKKALEAFDRSWGAATQSGDRAALERILADEFRAIPGTASKTQTIDNAVRNAEANRDNPQPGNSVTWDNYIVNCTPVSAMITHRNVVVSNDDGKETTTWTRSIHQVEKRGGRWQVVSTTGHPLDDEATLFYMDQDWTAANLRRDKAWYEKNFADDFRSVGSADGKVYTKSSDIEDTMNSKSKVEMTESTNQIIRVDRNVGIVIGIYHWKGTDENGKPFDNRSRYTDTYVKRNGRWLVLSTISVPIKDN